MDLRCPFSRSTFATVAASSLLGKGGVVKGMNSWIRGDPLQICSSFIRSNRHFLSSPQSWSRLNSGLLLIHVVHVQRTAVLKVGVLLTTMTQSDSF